MKFKLLIVLSLLFITISSCKNKCTDINCNGGTCIDGSCVCPAGFTGLNCQTIDPCLTVTCLNGGACVNATCNCLAGYEGVDCSIETRTKFYGSWIGSDGCTVSGTNNYSVTIISGSEIIDVEIENLRNEFNHHVIATISGTSLAIASQTPDSDGRVVSGVGTITSDFQTIHWNYIITDTNLGSTDNYTATWYKM